MSTPLLADGFLREAGMQDVTACQVGYVNKDRRGRPRYWCSIHGASATGPNGEKLQECDAARLGLDPPGEKLHIRPEEYAGGIALWGALTPVYDTTKTSDEPGIHVHARSNTSGEKVLDQTFPGLFIRVRDTLFEHKEVHVTEKAATNYFLSQTFDVPMTCIFCLHCGNAHLDSDIFAVTPHRKHLCHTCGKEFVDQKRAVSNPAVYLRENLEWRGSRRSLIRPERSFCCSQREFSGGLKVWASNPAIVWTQQKPEERGIHIHAYEAGNPVAMPDETFSVVEIDGVRLDEEMLRYLMAQRLLSTTRDYLVSLNCPKCGKPHFDRGRSAVTPHVRRTCENCRNDFRAPGNKRCISNPAVAHIAMLAEAAKSR